MDSGPQKTELDSKCNHFLGFPKGIDTFHMLSVHLLQVRLPIKTAQRSTWNNLTLFDHTFFFLFLSTTARLCIFAKLLVTMGKATSASHSATINSSALLFFLPVSSCQATQ